MVGLHQFLSADQANGWLFQRQNSRVMKINKYVLAIYHEIHDVSGAFTNPHHIRKESRYQFYFAKL